MDIPNGEKSVNASTGRFEKFSKFATVLGFANDVIGMVNFLWSTLAIVSVLLTVGVAPTYFFSQVHITPFHALGLWVLATFSYFGVLQMYWIKNRETKSFEKNFTGFLKYDIAGKNMLYLLPGIILLIFLLWILVEINFFLGGSYTSIALISMIFIFFGTLASIVILVETRGYRYSVRDQRIINENWKSIEKRIQSELSRRWYIKSEDIEDIQQKYRINNLSLIFAAYKEAHPKQVDYGYLMHRNSKLAVRVTDDYYSRQPKVLVSTNKIQKDKYYVSNTNR